MRKIISILLIILILFSGITIHLASHYCSMSLIDTKVSFSGSFAGCGMVHPQKHNSDYTFSNKCCEDVTSSITLNNNYFASSVASAGHDFQLSYALKVDQLRVNETSFSLSDIFARPPGSNIPNDVDRKIICIFRI